MVYYLYGVFAFSVGVLFVAGLVERRGHQRHLAEIPVRILVNGIRGKSSITRLVAGALRAGDLGVVAKTTGTAARFIHPDSTEEPVYRKFGIANVVEQIGVVRRAAAAEPDVLVMECMAIQPALQELNQEVLVRSTIGVLSNVREDHLEEMGPTLDDVARSLARSMPAGGVCVTAERDRRAVLEREAARRGCRLVAVDPSEVTGDEMAGFPYLAFKENVAIALAVAAELGVGREAALRGMYAAPPDPGVPSVEDYHTEDGTVRLANIFAANDPQSTVMNFRQLAAAGKIKPPFMTLINCRPDRIARNAQMSRLVAELDTDILVLIGHPTKSALDAVPADWRGRVLDLGGPDRDPADIWHNITRYVTGNTSLIAIGNIHGQGERLLEHLESLRHLPTPLEAR
ncbi:poly-gamma-glutamate synthase PgsB [Planotetraspora sp. A-T 1434]|uniref:poly-gamma-glutamate synthase PgsB n=1 Tax=Planotetraspora sp. A-T 1434 TaxID=2979219 RepID=UPI0021C1B95C|nr:poly-gamma-glutamate synthase PgsB [Planotetraspora sp. A-T 1434]MCT9935329.1 poly-gamma-glutamate synthase PgsB [Planotetraspora sp. A-T 1434]